MEKTKVSITEVIDDLKQMFSVDNNEFGTIEDKGKFYIQTTQFERHDVIVMLHDYFYTREIVGGYCSVANTTWLFTTFSVLEGVPLNITI